MIIEGRLKGSVDQVRLLLANCECHELTCCTATQVDAMLHFEASAEEAVRLARLLFCFCLGSPPALLPQDMFDAQITNICLGVQSVVEKIEARGVVQMT